MSELDKIMSSLSEQYKQSHGLTTSTTAGHENSKPVSQTPQSTKWYAGAKPTERELLGKITQIYREDPEYGGKRYAKYISEKSDPSSELYRQ